MAQKLNKPLKRNGPLMGVSLKDMMKVEEPELTSQKDEDLPADEFSIEQLLAIWEELLKDLVAQEKSFIVGAIRNTEILKTKPLEVSMLFHSNAAKAEFDKIKLEWIQKVKKSLNNYKIEFNLKVQVTDKNKPVIITPEDKFKAMAERNPLLNRLKEEFGLDFYS